jgi:type I restriction enzyme, S subunit
LRGLASVSEWRVSTWGEEITLEYGKGIRGYSNAFGTYRVFGSNGPVGWTSESLAPGPGIILGRKGAYRGVRFSPAPFFVIDTAYYVVPKTDHDMRWLYYAIIYHKLGEIDDGSPVPSTTRAAVYVRQLDVPPPEEQRAIGRVLGALDDKIDLNRRMNETLEAMARAIFKDWFIDFGPTRAKMEGLDPCVPKAFSDYFPDSFIETQWGEMPSTWFSACWGTLVHPSGIEGLILGSWGYAIR